MANGVLLNYNGSVLKMQTGAYAINNLVPENIKEGINIGGIVGTAPRPIGNLSDYSWAQIKQIVDADNVPAHWVGQTKEITSGTYNGYHIRCIDVASNRYQKSNRSGYAKTLFDFVELLPYTYSHNNTASNTSNWANSQIRNNVMPTILTALPQDLQDVIAEVIVVTCANGSTLNPTERETNDKLFLLSAAEIVPQAKSYSYVGQEYYAQAAYYYRTDHKKKDINGTVKAWWTRSPAYPTQQYYIDVTTGGGIYELVANSSASISPCFTI